MRRDDVVVLMIYKGQFLNLPDMPMNVIPQMILQNQPIRKQATSRSWRTPIPNTVQQDPHFSLHVISSVLAQHRTQTEAVIDPEVEIVGS